MCMSSPMGHQLAINDLRQKDGNKIQQTPVYSVSKCWLSLLRHGLGIFSTMKQIYKQCTQCLIPLFKDISDVDI